MRGDPLTDDQFDGQLDSKVESTRNLFAKDDYEEQFPTVVLVYPDTVKILSLVEEGDSGADLYEVLFAFGQKQPRRKQLQAVFVTIQSRWPDDRECIFVSGGTPGGRLNGASLDIVRTSSGMIRIGDVQPFYCRDKAEFAGRTYAGELLRGMR